MENYCDIPKYGSLPTVIHSVVRECRITDTDALTIREEDGLWVVTNWGGDTIGKDCSASLEALQSSIEVSEDEARFFDKRVELSRPVYHEYNHLIHDLSLHE